MTDLRTWMNDNMSSDEIAEIEAEASKEIAALRQSQAIAAKFISDLMEQQHLGFNEFARVSGISASHLSAILKGKTSPSLATISKMAARLGKSVSLNLS